jgi:hypothetical protein
MQLVWCLQQQQQHSSVLNTDAKQYCDVLATQLTCLNHACQVSSRTAAHDAALRLALQPIAVLIITVIQSK